MSHNVVCISGNLGRDAEIRRTQGSKPVANFSVAVSDPKRNPDTGEWETYTNWINCVLFGTRAERLENILVKGTKVSITGKLHYSEWERDGSKRSKIEVYVDSIELLSAKKEANEFDQPSTSTAGPEIYAYPEINF